MGVKCNVIIAHAHNSAALEQYIGQPYSKLNFLNYYFPIRHSARSLNISVILCHAFVSPFGNAKDVCDGHLFPH